MDTITRRHALRIVGGGAAFFGTASAFLSPTHAAGAVITLTVSLDKALYGEGDLMTLTVTEDVVKPDRRKIVISDSTGTPWRKVHDNRKTAVFTAVAGSKRMGANTVTVTLTRLPDGATASQAVSYTLGSQWVARFPGDREQQVMVGLAVTDKSNSNLRWADAVGLLGAAGASVAVRRCFIPAWISASNIDKWADWAEIEGVYPIISFKVPGNDWAGVAAGRFDSDLDLLCTHLDARAAAGRPPLCVAVHHEPAGDGDLNDWARMQEYLSNRFAPWKNTFCFTTISNGYDWGPKNGGKGQVEQVYPRSLIDALNRNGHILACDTYDSADATKLDYTLYDRTSLKLAGFIEWARAQGVQLIGLGEFGCHDDIDIDRCWQLVQDNRDLFAYSCHFNSGQNSRADWRMTPDGYPPDPAVTTYTDMGGSVASANRLAAGTRMFIASATARS